VTDEKHCALIGGLKVVMKRKITVPVGNPAPVAQTVANID